MELRTFGIPKVREAPRRLHDLELELAPVCAAPLRLCLRASFAHCLRFGVALRALPGFLSLLFSRLALCALRLAISLCVLRVSVVRYDNCLAIRLWFHIRSPRSETLACS